MQTRMGLVAVVGSVICLTGIEARAQFPMYGDSSCSASRASFFTISYGGLLPGPVQHDLIRTQMRLSQMQRAQARAAIRPYQQKIAREAAQRERDRKEIAARNPVRGHLVQVGFHRARSDKAPKIIHPGGPFAIGPSDPKPMEEAPGLEPRMPPASRLKDAAPEPSSDLAQAVEEAINAINRRAAAPPPEKKAPATQPAQDPKAIPSGQTPRGQTPRGQTPPDQS